MAFLKKIYVTANGGTAELDLIGFVVALSVILFSCFSAVQCAETTAANKSVALTQSGTVVTVPRFGRIDVYDHEGHCLITKFASEVSLGKLGIGNYEVKYSGVIGNGNISVDIGELCSQ